MRNTLLPFEQRASVRSLSSPYRHHVRRRPSVTRRRHHANERQTITLSLFTIRHSLPLSNVHHKPSPRSSSPTFATFVHHNRETMSRRHDIARKTKAMSCWRREAVRKNWRHMFWRTILQVYANGALRKAWRNVATPCYAVHDTLSPSRCRTRRRFPPTII
jgi:hypothetical protein